MTHLVLSKPDRDVLFTLIHFKEPASNNDLSELAAGIKIEGEQRKRLESHGLISSTNETKPRLKFFYELTELGWAWVEEELAAEAPAKADRTSRVNYPLHNKFASFIQRSGTPLSALFVEEPIETPGDESAEDISDAIVSAYRDNAAHEGDWVPLAELRSALGRYSRAEVDAALESQFREGAIRLIAEVNRKTLTQADRAAAVHAGGEDKHLIRVEQT